MTDREEELGAGHRPAQKLGAAVRLPRGIAPPRILLAEDDKDLRQLLAGQLRCAGYDVVESHDGHSLLEVLRSTLLSRECRGPFDLLVSDVRLPGLSGFDVAERLRDHFGFPPVILMTAFGSADAHQRASKLGAVAMLDKPFPVAQLLVMIRKIIRSSFTGFG